ncbi:helix-turn-helix transcriptional regulator [Streptomyces sp. NBC_01808]|uniref:helix-turn-helix transcriptional regulator n=1 Tax=Streptomyces sp. NBC_01808 TaxID=2975947 RepID=UPI002DD8783E|nr:helix-turn-helix transcriptional regulator [Streptomyces sp. NBC_01808]WSA39312.1 helix-turn-helix transcriptional regulator [Streptomyces sp. NBC_01808]
MHAGHDHEHGHSLQEPCPAAREAYAVAVRDGRIAAADARHAPCLNDLALLSPDPDDPDWLLPVPASEAMMGLLVSREREIRERQQHAADLAKSFSRFIDIGMEVASDNSPITVLEGLGTINTALDLAVGECSHELLTIQPEAATRRARALGEALQRVRPLAERGVRMRTLYQHAAREAPMTLAYLRFVGPQQVEVRTLEEIIERLIIVDRQAAFLPARPDRKVALELRHPGLVSYLVGVFEQFWQLATPLEEAAYTEATHEGVTGVQRSIARLLVEGHLDQNIARRLGMNVRTCRAHIAKLATTLGSSSRTQLGYLIARSGILDET